LKQQELEARGLEPAEARFAAQRELGNVTRAREDARAVWIWPWLESVWQDTVYVLIMAQGNCRIDSHRPSRRNLARQQGD
jgi:hypothetical protein